MADIIAEVVNGVQGKPLIFFLIFWQEKRHTVKVNKKHVAYNMHQYAGVDEEDAAAFATDVKSLKATTGFFFNLKCGEARRAAFGVRRYADAC
jgi:hypothetical protein